MGFMHPTLDFLSLFISTLSKCYNSTVADAAARLRPKYDEILKLSVTSVETAWKYTNLSDQIGAVCFDPSANFVCVAGMFSQIRSAQTGALHCWARALPGASCSQISAA